MPTGSWQVFEVKVFGLRNQIATDSYWAGNKRHRKSAGYSVLRVHKNSMYSQVQGQVTHTQSLGEAELYGNVSGTSAALGLQHVLDSVEMPVDSLLEE